MREWNELIGKTQHLMISLREQYYADTEPRSEPYNRPPQIVTDEPLGPWPEFIFHSVSCARSEAGKCAPCFYSRVQPVGAPRSVIYDSLLQQLEYVLARFDTLVLAAQTRLIDFPNFTEDSARKPVLMGLAMSGSILSDEEIPPEYREEIFRRVVEFGEVHNVAFQLLIETHVHDVKRLHRTGELAQLAKLLEPASLVNLMGFESADDFVREVLYVKGITLGDFKEAVSINREYGFVPGAFIFSGLHSMTQREIANDVRETLRYLRELDVVPALMFPHLQPYTPSHLLHVHGRYEIIDLHTISEMVGDLLSLFKPQSGAEVDPWFIGMEGGPPEPVGGVFQNPDRIMCDTCASALKRALRRLRRDYNYPNYRQEVAALLECACRTEYEEYVRTQTATTGSIPLLQRVAGNIDFATRMRDDYLASLEEATS